MKQLLLVFICLFFILPTKAFTITGGVSYTVNEARTIAFNSLDQIIDTSIYKDYFIDKKYNEHKYYITKRKFRTKYCKLTSYSDNSYSVSYLSTPKISFYYDNLGKLESIGYTFGNSYPKKGVKYYKNGTLEEICLIISPKEQFIFDKHKNLIAHWIGNNCYNEQGELVMTRE